jgi:protoporphyrin/coproporphyrin ferrochelatase
LWFKNFASEIPSLSVASQSAAVLLLAHGSPDSVDQIPEFLLRVTGGRPLPPESIEEIQHRYGLIGRSPLTELTRAQAELLSDKIGLKVYVGMRNWHPYIADTVRAMVADGVRHAIVICLAPQNSRTSVGLYRSALAKENPPFNIDFIDSWHDHPSLIQAFAEKLRARRPPNVPIIFTAHSVPQRTVTDGDPYEDQAQETASLVATRAALAPDDWTFAFQSQGISGGPWLGPTVEDTILGLKRNGHNAVFVQPIGFLCDHVEVLYDIDIAFKQFAEKQDMRLTRAESLNDSPLLTDALADLVSRFT